MKFTIRYTLNNEPMTETVEALTPVKALNLFHESMQLVSMIESTAYKIVSLALSYNADPQGRVSGGTIHSRYDLPKSANPVLKPKAKVKQEPDPVMPFYNEVEKHNYD